MADPVILWFRQDLRLHDNAALVAAAESGSPVIAVYVLDDEACGPWAPGAASRWWLHHSLQALGESLNAINSRLILRRGPTADVLLAIAAEAGARAVHFTRAYEPHSARLELAVNAACGAAGIEVRRFSGALLMEPETLRNQSGASFRVFTPFWRTVLAAERPRVPVPAPRHLSKPKRWPNSDRLDAWGLLPLKPKLPDRQ